jgi:hypothetical protein
MIYIILVCNIHNIYIVLWSIHGRVRSLHVPPRFLGVASCLFATARIPRDIHLYGFLLNCHIGNCGEDHQSGMWFEWAWICSGGRQQRPVSCGGGGTRRDRGGYWFGFCIYAFEHDAIKC